MSTSQHSVDGVQTPLFDDNSDTFLHNRNPNNMQAVNSSSNTIKQNDNITPVTNSCHSEDGIKIKSAQVIRPTTVFIKLKTYLLALRPWSLSASLVPTLLGLALAYRSSTPHEFNFFTFILILFTVITVHGAGNVVNTYYDYVKGIDNRKSDDRTLVDHILSKDEVNFSLILNN